MEISHKLQEMLQRDQKARTKIRKSNYTDADVADLEKINLENMKAFKKIYKDYGLITIKDFGAEASLAAFTIVQHSADSDITFMKKYLNDMEKNINEINKSFTAYLKDKILLKEKKPQIYGTQIMEDGKPWEILDPDNVNERRAKVGLPPLEEYIRQHNAQS